MEPERLVRIKPRSRTLYIAQDRTVLSTNREGFLEGDPETGLFFFQTRVLSRFLYRINGRKPYPVSLSAVQQHSCLGYYILRVPRDDNDQDILERPGSMTNETLELKVSRYVGTGMHEDIDLTNYGRFPTVFSFELEVDADFQDLIETSGERQQKGTTDKRWIGRTEDSKSPELLFDYNAQREYHEQNENGTADFHAGMRIRFENASSAPVFNETKIRFEIELQPKKNWHVCLQFLPSYQHKEYDPLFLCRSFANSNHWMEQKKNAFAAGSADFSAHPQQEHPLTAIVQSALSQAKNDLGTLRLFDLDVNGSGWVPAAGLPVYTGLYGRDVLTAAWQAAMLGPEIMRGALHHLARLQGKESNDWRDEDPGKMMHEARTGPLSQLNFIPNGLYYGSVTTSGFYSVILSELWHWTGDKALIAPFLEPALTALQWLERGSDLDSDGFYEYQTRSRKGLKNQGWKDSDDGILDENGNSISTPIATCEEQAFVYVAKLHLSEVLWWMDRKEEARLLYHQAQELRKRFSERFWLSEERYPALALDAQKRAIPTVASNAGHCVSAGILEQEYVVPTVQRMMSDELFSGWGIRTLSNQHPAFNPYSYHRGSVWPVEQATFVLGMVRYGLHAEAAQLARAFFEAASCFEYCRLPELFAGHQRDEDHPFPAAYPEACWPQAWSSSAVFGVIQSLLGLYPYAPLHMLIVDPHLPDWLPEITVKKLQVGRAIADIHFSRSSDGKTGFHVKRLEGPLHVIHQPSPWSITAGFAERTKDLLTSFI